MFRSLFKRSRTIRVPIENAGVQVQQVRVITRPGSRTTSFITTWLIAYVVYRTVESSDILGDGNRASPANEGLEKWKRIANKNENSLGESWHTEHGKLRQIKQESTKREVGSGKESQVQQITLPIWIRRTRAGVYMPESVEFKEFAKLQNDKKRVEGLKREVGKMVMERLRNPYHEPSLRFIGYKGALVLSLDIVPQPVAPRLYQVPCIAISGTEIGFGWRTLSPQLGERIERVFRPWALWTAAKGSFVAFMSASYAITSAKLSEALGQSKEPAAPGANKRAKVHPALLPVKTVLSEKEIARDNAMPSMSTLVKNQQGMQELIRAIHDGPSSRSRHREIVKAMPYSLAVQYAATTFKRLRYLAQVSVLQSRTRGLVHIRGVVTCIGSRGKYRMEVMACYVPGEDCFIGPMTIKEAYILADYPAFQKAIEAGDKEVREAKEAKEAKAARERSVQQQTKPVRPANSTSPSDKDTKP